MFSHSVDCSPSLPYSPVNSSICKIKKTKKLFVDCSERVILLYEISRYFFVHNVVVNEIEVRANGDNITNVSMMKLKEAQSPEQQRKNVPRHALVLLS